MMTVKKDAADKVKNRYVHNPAITILSMTTPSTLFATLGIDSIKDGFVNRFLMSISEAERTVRIHKDPVDVPDSILNWIKTIGKRADKIHISTEDPQAITINFKQDALNLQDEFQHFCIEKANFLEKFGMDELPMRSNEIAMRISLIVALSRDPNTEFIEAEDMRWSIEYVKNCLEKTIDCLKVSVSHSGFEHWKKEVLADLREKGDEGMLWSKMQKTPPYSQHKPKDLREILESLKEADLIISEDYKNEGKGRPTIKWIAI
jgi:hypothetical protein